MIVLACAFACIKTAIPFYKFHDSPSRDKGVRVLAPNQVLFADVDGYRAVYYYDDFLGYIISSPDQTIINEKYKKVLENEKFILSTERINQALNLEECFGEINEKEYDQVAKYMYRDEVIKLNGKKVNLEMGETAQNNSFIVTEVSYEMLKLRAIDFESLKKGK